MKNGMNIERLPCVGSLWLSCSLASVCVWNSLSSENMSSLTSKVLILSLIVTSSDLISFTWSCSSGLGFWLTEKRIGNHFIHLPPWSNWTVGSKVVQCSPKKPKECKSFSWWLEQWNFSSFSRKLICYIGRLFGLKVIGNYFEVATIRRWIFLDVLLGKY